MTIEEAVEKKLVQLIEIKPKAYYERVFAKRKVHRLWYNGHNQERTLCSAGRGSNAWKMCCGENNLKTTDDPDKVTCLACRRLKED